MSVTFPPFSCVIWSDDIYVVANHSYQMRFDDALKERNFCSAIV